MDNWRKGYPQDKVHVLLLIEDDFEFEDGGSEPRRYVCEGFYLKNRGLFKGGWFKVLDASISRSCGRVVGWMRLPDFERYPNRKI